MGALTTMNGNVLNHTRHISLKHRFQGELLVVCERQQCDLHVHHGKDSRSHLQTHGNETMAGTLWSRVGMLPGFAVTKIFERTLTLSIAVNGILQLSSNML
jgi:hypothetical protein